MAHTIYDNFILANKLTDILITKIDLNSYLTVDTSMTEQAGMKKIINTYTATGDVEELAMGQGNSSEITVSFVPTEYEVKTYQGFFQYFDEQEMTDPMIVDAGLDGAAKTMVNNFTEKAVAEYEKATLNVPASAWSFDVVVDAIAKMNLESEEGLFLLISRVRYSSTTPTPTTTRLPRSGTRAQCLLATCTRLVSRILSTTTLVSTHVSTGRSRVTHR